MFWTTRSRKPFRRNGESGSEYSLLLGYSSSDNEGTILNTSRSALQLVSQGIPSIPHPFTPLPPPPLPHTPTPSPPPPSPPQPFNMANTMKILIFKGVGSEDPEKLWFVANSLWIAQQITDNNLEKVQLFTTLQDRVLTWYIKFCQET